MDLQKMRPTHSQWRTPFGGIEGRIRQAPSATAVKQLKQPPVGKGGPLWCKFYDDAVARGHPEPERLADTLLRSREHAFELEAKRRKTIVTTDPPKPIEASARDPPKKGRVAVADANRCKALTLEGKRCGFKATCGSFCKKHAVVTWRQVSDRSLFSGVTLKGFLNASPSQVTQVFGQANGRPTDAIKMEWMVMFDDDTMAILHYTKDDPALCVSGRDMKALGRVRDALTL